MSKLLYPMLFVLSGCGPMQMPMVNRLDADAQKQVDEAWNKAVRRVNQLDRQQWLDLFVGAQIFQAGVDHLSLRSEKKLAEGHVVMEVTFDRANPEKDRFAVQFFDPAGKMSRELLYQREEIEKTYHDLFVGGAKEGKIELNNERQQANQESRWAAICEFFPKAKENK